MNLRAEIRAFADAHDGREPEQLAEMFIRGCDKDDLLPLLVQEFKGVERDATRLVEIAALAARSGHPTVATLRSGLGELAALLDEPYRIGDGFVRRFGALTAEQHRVRVEMLRAEIGGLQRAVAFHEQAIAVIEEHKVNCLDDIAQRSEAAA